MQGLISLYRFVRNGEWWRKGKLLARRRSIVDAVPFEPGERHSLVIHRKPPTVLGDQQLWNRVVSALQYGTSLTLQDRATYRGPCYSIHGLVFLPGKGWDFDSLQGTVDKVPSWNDVAALHRPAQVSEPTILLNTLWSENYFHWMLEVLPRLAALKEEDQAAKVVLPDHPKPFHWESLERSGWSAERVLVPSSPWVKFENAIYLSAPTINFLKTPTRRFRF